jgi:hypothetical protein
LSRAASRRHAGDVRSDQGLQLLLEAPIDDAKRLQAALAEAGLEVGLVRPESCGST